jgi:diguanylate cyclase (GGDEF)-like protein
MHQIPDNESQRLIALESYRILDTLPEQAYDNIARLAAYICGVDKAMVAFIDKDRKWHKARFNVKSSEMPRDYVICAKTILSENPFIVSKASEDERVSNIGMVFGPPHLQFYAGVPLIAEGGLILGTVCAIDTEPHEMSQEQIELLQALGRQVMQLLKLRKNIILVEDAEKRLQAQQKQLSENNKTLQKLSITDELTGLNNRRSLNEALEKETVRAARYYTPLSVLMIDVDHFKQFNDQFGHHTGDIVLTNIAKAIQSHCRTSDFCARYGGEKFVVLLPHTTLRDAKNLARQYCTDIANLNIGDQQVTISIGVSEFDPQQTIEDLFTSADTALHRAKEAGRNRAYCSEE